MKTLILVSDAQSAALAEPGKPWAVVKVGRFRDSHGALVEVTPKRLKKLAESYDPAIERAAINFDHAKDGPAHGTLRDPFVEGDTLYAYPADLSEDAQRQITSRARFRQSAEITFKHDVTGDWYLAGLALLGASRSAVKGLAEITLSEPPDGALVLLEEPTTHEEEMQMELPEIAAGLKITAKEAAKPDAPPPPSAADASALAEGQSAHFAALAELAAQTATLREQSLATATLNAKTRAALAANRVDTDLAPLIAEARIVPAMLRDGKLRAALVSLAAAENPQTVELSAANGATDQAPLYEILLAALKSVPSFGAATAGQLAGVEVGAALAGDKRSDEQRRVDAGAKVADARALELQERYPRMFAN